MGGLSGNYVTGMGQTLLTDRSVFRLYERG